MEPTAFLDALSRIGVDVLDALARFMGNRDLYLSFLCRLPKALDLNAIRQALRSGQEEDFYARVHELKGMTGNLSVRTLFQPARPLPISTAIPIASAPSCWTSVWDAGAPVFRSCSSFRPLRRPPPSPSFSLPPTPGRSMCSTA